MEGTLDWYATYEELECVFCDYRPPKADTHVLMVGCGNSALSSEMHEAGFRRISNIDISAAAVAKMQLSFGQLGMEWQVMDATAMTFPHDSFDLAVDKGTVDAMMSGGGDDAAMALSAEVWRTLRPGGIFVLVSHSGQRQAMLNEGVCKAHNVCWEMLELRRCRLSPQATLINILRSKLHG